MSTTDKKDARWLAEANHGEGPTPMASLERSDLDAITEAMGRRDAAQRDVGAAVARARAAGASWRLIGDALGVTRQGAHDRYAHV